jgi:hypothetical protein
MSAWRIAQNVDDFLHKILKAKYFPDSSIWRPNSNVPKSDFGLQSSRSYLFSRPTLTTRSHKEMFLFGVLLGAKTGQKYMTTSSFKKPTTFILPR